MRRVVSMLAPVALLATGACFATHQDVQLLQNDVLQMRADAAHADSLRSQQLATVIASLGTVRDSLRVVSTRLVKFQGDVRGDLYSLGQQLIQVQELTGQSQQRLQELRASLDQRDRAMGTQQQQQAAPGDTTGTQSASIPGPNQLFQLSLDQLHRGSAGAAASGLQTLLKNYPTTDIAPDALYFLGEAYSASQNTTGADSAYSAVVLNYPESPRAPMALYKHALILQAAGNLTGARAAFNEIIKRYPRSDEAALAKDRLKTIK